MKFKNIIYVLFLLSALVLCANTVQANSEIAQPDGGFNSSIVGVTIVSTGPGNYRTETRQIRTTNSGQLRVIYGVEQSSWITVASSANTRITNTYTQDLSTFVITLSSPNANVFDVASASEPILLKGWVVGGQTLCRFRVFDSRGSTDTAQVRCVYDRILSTGQDNVDFHVWLSSGLTALVTSSGCVASSGGYESYGVDKSGLPLGQPQMGLYWQRTKNKKEY